MPQAFEKSFTIGIIMPNLSNPFYGELSNVLAWECQRHNCQSRLEHSDLAGIDHLMYINYSIENPEIDGLLMATYSFEETAPIYQMAHMAGKPVIFLNRRSDHVPADLVRVDHLQGGKMATQHLIALGHREIAYIGIGATLPDLHYEGYLQALREAGLPVQENLVIMGNDHRETTGKEGVRCLLKKGISFSAVFGRNDLIACSVTQGLQQAGLQVPDDISVIGFDNTILAAQAIPPLTTIDHNLTEMGKIAVQFLLDRLTGRHTWPHREHVMAPRLVLRSSTRPPKE